MLKYLQALALSAIAVFAPIEPTLIAVIAIIFIDLVTGIWASIKRGEKIQSNGIRRTISKIILFELALCFGFLAEKYLLFNSVPVVKLIAGVICLSESKSVFENLDYILGRSLFSMLIEQIGSASNKKKT